MNINLNENAFTAIKKIANRIETLRGLVTVNAYGEVDQWAIIRGERYESEVATLTAPLGIGNPVDDIKLGSDIIKLRDMAIEFRGIVASTSYSDIPADEWLVAKRTALATKINTLATEIGIA